MFSELNFSVATISGKFDNVKLLPNNALCSEIDLMKQPSKYSTILCVAYKVGKGKMVINKLDLPGLDIALNGKFGTSFVFVISLNENIRKYFKVLRNGKTPQIQLTDKDYKKAYKVKMFLNGSLHMTGSVKVDSSDAEQILCDVRRLLRVHIPEIKLDFLCPVMMNFKTALVDRESKIYLPEMYKIISNCSKITIDKFNYQVLETKYNQEEANAVILEIGIPSTIHQSKKKEKRATIKIYESGKINIDNCTNLECAEILCKWMINLITAGDNLIFTYED